MSYFDTDKVRQSGFLAIIIGLGFVLFRELQAFIPAFLGALTLYVLMRKYQLNLVQNRKWKPTSAAVVLMFLSLLIILLPILLIVNLLTSKINIAVSHSDEVVNALKIFLTNLETKIGFNLFSENNISQVGSHLANMLPSVLGATFNTLLTITIMYFLLFFMLVSGGKMEAIFYQFLPITGDGTNRIAKEINTMVVSNAVVIPVIAILQGVVGLIGYLILGVKEPMLWFAVTCVTAMLPVVGAAVAYIPVSIIFFAQDEAIKGFIMLGYGLGVIGTVDNIFRFAIAKKIGNIHPVITILGVIIGIDLFGFIGLVFGPLLISMFLLLIRLYLKEFHNKSKRKTSPE